MGCHKWTSPQVKIPPPRAHFFLETWRALEGRINRFRGDRSVELETSIGTLLLVLPKNCLTWNRPLKKGISLWESDPFLLKSLFISRRVVALNEQPRQKISTSAENAPVLKTCLQRIKVHAGSFPPVAHVGEPWPTPHPLRGSHVFPALTAVAQNPCGHKTGSECWFRGVSATEFLAQIRAAHKRSGSDSANQFCEPNIKLRRL